MAIQRSKDAVLRLATTTASSPSGATDPAAADELEHITDMELTKGRDSIEADELGNDGKRREYGMSDFSISVGVNFDSAATVQQRVRDALRNGDKLIAHLLYDGTSGFENIVLVGEAPNSFAPSELADETYELSSASGNLWNTV